MSKNRGYQRALVTPYPKRPPIKKKHKKKKGGETLAETFRDNIIIAFPDIEAPLMTVARTHVDIDGLSALFSAFQKHPLRTAHLAEIP